VELPGPGPYTIDTMPPDPIGWRGELLDGQLIMSPLADADHQDLVTALLLQLVQRVPLGLKVVPGTNVIVEDHTLLIPDVAVVDPEHLVHKRLGYSPLGVVLAIEITSPSTRKYDLTTKRELARAWGMPMLIVDRAKTLNTVIVEGELPDWALDLHVDP
jgi:Uma2 family endonuclease